MKISMPIAPKSRMHRATVSGCQQPLGGAAVGTYTGGKIRLAKARPADLHSRFGYPRSSASFS